LKILLISMPDTTFQLRISLSSIPNLGLASLAGNLKGVECDAKILDLVHKPYRINKTIKKTIEDFKPDVVGLSAWTYQYDTLLKIARFVKSLKSDIKVVAGGYHPTLMSEELGKDEDPYPVDFIVRGEGELTFKELVRALKEDRKDFSSIKGISYRKNGCFVHNPKRELADLNELELPDRSERILKAKTRFHSVLDLVETSRGCYLNCKFCSITQMYGKVFRTFPIERVIRDIRNAKQNGAQSVFFVDDNITLDVKRFESLCDAIIESGLNDLKYYIQASTKGISSSEKLSRKMRKAGFRAVYMGIECGSDETLEFLDKGSTTNHTMKAIENLRGNDIRVFGGFIVGNPDDTKKDVKNVFKFAKKINVDYLGLGILTPLPKTVIRDELLQQGLILNKDDYSKYNGFECNIKTKYLSDKQLKRLVSRGYLGYTWHMLFHSGNLWSKPYYSMKNLALLGGIIYLMFSYMNGNWRRSDFHRF